MVNFKLLYYALQCMRNDKDSFQQLPETSFMEDTVLSDILISDDEDYYSAISVNSYEFSYYNCVLPSYIEDYFTNPQEFSEDDYLGDDALFTAANDDDQWTANEAILNTAYDLTLYDGDELWVKQGDFLNAMFRRNNHTRYIRWGSSYRSELFTIEYESTLTVTTKEWNSETSEYDETITTTDYSGTYISSTLSSYTFITKTTSYNDDEAEYYVSREEIRTASLKLTMTDLGNLFIDEVKNIASEYNSYTDETTYQTGVITLVDGEFVDRPMPDDFIALEEEGTKSVINYQTNDQNAWSYKEFSSYQELLDVFN